MQYLSKEKSKELKKLLMKKYRDQRKLLLVEGIRTIKQLSTYQIPLLEIYCTEEEIEHYSDIISQISSESVFIAKDFQLKQLSSAETPQSLIALVEMKTPEFVDNERLLFIDRVSNPGNLGTIFRVAKAALIDGIILSPECCDIYNPKVVRASMGTVFALPSMISDYQYLKGIPNKVIITSLSKGVSIYDIESNEHPYVLVVGSEATGINEELVQIADKMITIPMAGGIESLNVAVATSICLYFLNRDILT
ncbi:MAG: RNA methyltransferase [Candidatus Cloacimonetes bacterium]|nr:RNA methyltransferase [Candidatus Cloacimonadota bacterium]